MLTTELLSPAGTLKNMRYSFAYGADAVYAGPPRYSLRVRNNEFYSANLAIGIKEAHHQNKKFYVVANITPHNAKLKTFINDLNPIIDMGPDALIISDPGLIMLVREFYPTMPIHLSVQANAVNWASVKFWQTMGIKRVILSRELSLEEIEEIRQIVPEIELEVFVHGSMCIAYSGRCLLSTYINRRDSNQGACINTCRWKYNLLPAKEDVMGNVELKNKCLNSSIQISSQLFSVPLDQEVFLLDSFDHQTTSQSPERRQSQYLPTFEDVHGTYIFNSKDLRAIRHVQRLIQIGIHSLKIEGRTKSFYYCARTAQIYRWAINDALHRKPFNYHLLEMLEGLANRGYTEGFFSRHQTQNFQNISSGFSRSFRQIFVGEFTGERREELAQVAVKNKFSCGDNLDIITPSGNINVVLDRMENKNFKLVSVAPGEGHLVWIPVPLNLGSIKYALLVRNQVIPSSIL
ncbi:MAG: tRNA 5-hydroxyuridine modification protein YegQ [Candidatus Dasytiphilus stammeri]